MLWQAWDMEISLPPDLQAIVEEQVRRGLYQDASAAISAALRRIWIGPSTGSREMVEMLLEGIDGPYEPLTEKTREEIRQLAANLPDE